VWYQCILCTCFRRFTRLFVDKACRPHYSVEGRGPPSRCQSSKPDVVRDRRGADRRFKRL
jgi:hypothetical protein